ncbi:hypothetical protein [Chelativorans sp. AA-79]|uniref:hypothetical protein n=1 Tax=Chelativorans sp. AA-79 TaxID=3028735 RepID=UPI0023FA283F|nr:hypothetical protein [Chelativorans sp. AA-79]WEX11649.1 hypothetical protein PVE73_12345 [Chelativorans sp. AA-79]
MTRGAPDRASSKGRTGFPAIRIFAAAGLVGALAACRGEPGPLSLQADARNPVSVLQRVNQAGAECWMRSSDPDFRDLRLVPELDTSAGRPRLLVLEKGNTSGLPVMVIEASGSPVTIETYGPLAGTRTGARVNDDIARWSGGHVSCS